MLTHISTNIKLENVKKNSIRLGIFQQHDKRTAEIAHQKAIHDAIKLLNEDLERKTPVIPGSLRDKNIQLITNALGKHLDPIALIQSILLVNKMSKLLNEMHSNVLKSLLEHPYPLLVANALRTILKTGLLFSINPNALTNCNHVIAFSELWFGDQRTRELFDSFPANESAQCLLDSLVMVSQELLPDQSNIEEIRSDIAELFFGTFHIPDIR